MISCPPMMVFPVQVWVPVCADAHGFVVNRGLFARQLNPQGTPLSCFDDPLFRRSPSLKKQQPEPVFESLFTRSSLMMFMLGEILTQTLITINSPATRARGRLPNLPRRLRRLIFTVPTAMPMSAPLQSSPACHAAPTSEP